MGKVSEIQDILYLYNSVDKDIKSLQKLSNKSRNVLKRSIIIGEGLDYEILLDLDNSGKEKLNLGTAEFLANNIVNIDEQVKLYHEIKGKNNKEARNIIKNNMICDICCESIPIKEIMPCCNNKLCQTCLYRHLITTLSSYYFKGCKCPFCNAYYSIEYIRYITNDIYYFDKSKWHSSLDYELWRYSTNYKKKTHLTYHNRARYVNSYRYYLSFIHLIETMQNKVVYDNYTDINYLLQPNENENEKIYGQCNTCCRDFHSRVYNHRPQNFNRLYIGTIDKECANAEGGLLEITPNLFKCVVCKSREEDMENVVIKKCPHCGVRTMRPDGCNYVVCGNHRWCWICEERLENNSDGHNTHYYTGVGSSAYSDKCRTSINYDAPKFTIDGKCKCSSCKKHKGAPLCRTLECMNRTSLTSKFNKYCDECQEDINDLLH
tara:strand:+ start:47 stop:1348 length:1302 start_codon:yes stop_codon:yes gene_type:complete